jgi:hypothetical protein
MMLAIYFVLGWCLIGGIAALLMGRAIAICSGETRRDEMAETGAMASAQASAGKKTLPAAKAA